MAVVTSLALGASAATAIAAGGLTVSAVTAGMSFAQAGKQRNLQRQAQQDAAQAMEEARKRTQVNYYDQLGINKEPFALQREALLVQGAQGIQAAREGGTRGLEGEAGRQLMAQNQGQAAITAAMGQQISELDKLKAQEDSRLRDINLQLDIGNIQGAQQAANDAGVMAAAANKSGLESVAGLAKGAIALGVPLYKSGRPDSAVTNAPAGSAVNTNFGQSGYNMNQFLNPMGTQQQKLQTPFGGGNPYLYTNADGTINA